MAKLFIQPDGAVEGLYTDIVPLYELGYLNVTRATHIEFNSKSQEWVVSLPDGTEVYRHKIREEALSWERIFCETWLTRGFRPKI